MAQHKYKVGDIVTFARSFVKLPAGPFEVIRLLPLETPDPTYRIKSKAEQHERVVREYEISAG
jgi:hypothetical protein